MVFYKGEGKNKFKVEVSALEAYFGFKEDERRNLKCHIQNDSVMDVDKQSTPAEKVEIRVDKVQLIIDTLSQVIKDESRKSQYYKNILEENQRSYKRFTKICKDLETFMSVEEDKDALAIEAMKFLINKVFPVDKESRAMVDAFNKVQSSILGVQWIKRTTKNLTRDLHDNLKDEEKCRQLIMDALVNIRSALKGTLIKCGKDALIAKGLMFEGETDEDFVEVNAVRQVAYAVNHDSIRGLVRF